VAQEQEQKKSPAIPIPAQIDVAKAQEVIFQPNPGPQTDFLSANEQEALFGGAAGGGKSFAMLADPVRYFNNPMSKKLLVRRSTEELRELISVSKQLYPRAIPGIKFLEREKTWVAPSGATLWMSYLDRDEDVTRYQGQAFCVAKGTKVVLGDGTLSPVESLKVGDKVASLSGPRDITWVSGRQQKKSVKVSFYSLCGHLLAQQSHPDTHPIALLSSKPLTQCSDLYRNIEKFQISPLQWLSYKHLESPHQENPDSASSVVSSQNYCKGSGDDTLVPQQQLGSFYLGVRHVPSPQSTQDHVSTGCYYPCRFLKSLLDSGQDSLEISGGPQQPDELGKLQSHRNKVQTLCGDVTCAPSERKTLQGFQPRCSFDFCQCDVQPPHAGENDLETSPQQDGAVGLGPPCPHCGERGYTLSRTRYLRNTYNHPYTQEQQRLEVPLELCIVRVEPLDEPFLDVYDITVNSSNNYITEGGIVNKNCWIGFDELTQWPTPYAWNYMRSRLRTPKGSGLKLYQRATTNPGGPGHTWVKKTFIDPEKPNKAFWATDIDTGEMMCWPKGHSREGQPLFKRRFIPATLFDNPYLADDGMYEANLLSMPEHQRRQLLEGDWSVSEGAAFGEFNTKIHVVEPFEIPNSWARFRAADYGYSSHSGVLWFAVVPHTEQIVVYRELYTQKVTAVDLADLILDAEVGDKIRYGVLDSSLWHNRGDTGPSLAEQMIMKGCRWRPADRSKGSRVAGKNEIHRRLQVDEFTEEPRMVIFNTCRNLISQLPSIPLDRNNPEDVDTKSEDHLYDALRYGLMSRPKSNLFDYDANVHGNKFQPADQIMGY